MKIPLLYGNNVYTYYTSRYMFINHIYHKGFHDFLCCRVINNEYYGFLIKRI